MWDALYVGVMGGVAQKTNNNKRALVELALLAC